VSSAHPFPDEAEHFMQNADIIETKMTEDKFMKWIPFCG
jgi:hypothetical protein